MEDCLSSTPDDCLLEIFKFLDRKDIYHVTRANKRLHQLYANQSLEHIKWKNGWLHIAETVKGYCFDFLVRSEDFPIHMASYQYEIYKTKEGDTIEKKLIDGCLDYSYQQPMHDFAIPANFFVALKDILRFHEVKLITIDDVPFYGTLFEHLESVINGSTVEKMECTNMKCKPIVKHDRMSFASLVKNIKHVDLSQSKKVTPLVNEEFFRYIADSSVTTFTTYPDYDEANKHPFVPDKSIISCMVHFDTLCALELVLNFNWLAEFIIEYIEKATMLQHTEDFLGAFHFAIDRDFSFHAFAGQFNGTGYECSDVNTKFDAVVRKADGIYAYVNSWSRYAKTVYVRFANKRYTRKRQFPDELLGGKDVIVTKQFVEPIELARAIADVKNREDDDDAFVVVNLDSLLERFQLWKRELPNVEPFYAVKCNSDAVIVHALAKMGVGFDVASREEIDIVTQAGVAPERIIYANPCKTRAFISHAEKKGINMMTYDSEEELEKISKLHKKPELILRIGVSDPTATCPLSVKFGVDPVQRAPELLKCAAERGMSVVGVSFHVGSGCNDPGAYRVGIQHARNLFDYGCSLGHQMQIVDIGGGFPGGDHPKTSFEQIASLIRSAVEEFFPEPGVRIVAEPGRFFAARPCALVVNVISHKAETADKITKNPADADKKGHMYYINDGLFGSFNCILYDHVNPTGKPLFDKEGKCFPSTIWGPTCDSIDQIEGNKMMRVLDVGEWIIYEEMGAYSTAAGSTFNGFQRPTPVHVISKRTWKALGLGENKIV